MRAPKTRDVITVVLIVVAFAFGLVTSGVAGRLMPSVESAREVNAKTIEESVRAISELVTLSYNYTDVGELTDQKMVNWVWRGDTAPLW